MRFHEAVCCRAGTGESDGEVRLVSDGKKVLDVHVKGGVIRVKELQLSGKKRMGVEEFLRGFHIEEYTL